MRVRPSRRKWLLRVAGGVGAEGIVGLQGMGLDGEILHPGVIREHERHGGSEAAPAALVIEEMRDGARAGCFPGQRLVDGGGEGPRAIVVEQIREATELGHAGIAVGGPLREEAVEARDGLAESLAGGHGPGGDFGRRERGEMRGVFHDHAGVVAPHVARDLGGPVYHAHEGGIGE
jgi:hypothetical protein